jgi:beta-barrel assembly-enhancing protease
MTFSRSVAILLLVALSARADGLPDLGDSSQASFSPQQEHQLGLQVMAEVRADRAYLDDPEVTDYLNNLGSRLISNSQATQQDFEFFVVRDNTLNAFALPGGFIGVHTGLIQATQSESELASVLAHEIGHITQHHLARMIAGQSQNSLGMLAALALAILAARSNPQLSQAAVVGAQAASIQSQLNFTREHEREADRAGLQTVVQAGFDPRAMAAFFERLQKYSRLYENNAPVYLRTHPLTTERISEIQNRIEKLPYRQVPSSLDFYLVRARLNVILVPAKEALRNLETGAGEKGAMNEVGHHYALALALFATQDFKRAQEELAKARQGAGEPNPMLENLAAELKRGEGTASASLEIYRNALKRFPGDRALNYGYIDALLESGQPSEALKFVDGRLKVIRDDYHYYELRAKTYASLGKRMLQHQSQAEAYVRQGNLSAAIEQLQIALHSGDGDFYQLSSAEARLKELGAMLKAEKSAGRSHF